MVPAAAWILVLAGLPGVAPLALPADACAGFHWETDPADWGPLEAGKEYHTDLTYWSPSPGTPGCSSAACFDAAMNVNFKTDEIPPYATASFSPSRAPASLANNGTYVAKSQLKLTVNHEAARSASGNYTVSASGCGFPAAAAHLELINEAPPASSAPGTPSEGSAAAPPGETVDFGTGAQSGIPGPGAALSLVVAGTVALIRGAARRR